MQPACAMAEGFDFDAAGRLFVTQHGRDQLHEDWPELYSAEQGFNLPGRGGSRTEGGRRLWPGRTATTTTPAASSCWRLEYGGDGGKKVGDLRAKHFRLSRRSRRHWAPNDLKFYEAVDASRQAYRGGAFIAFHGSWNRAPGPQGGYSVVFQPLCSTEKLSGKLRRLRRRICRRPQRSWPGRAPAIWSCRWTGWRALRFRRRQGPHLAHNFQRRSRTTTLRGGGDCRSTSQSASPQASPPEGIHPEASLLIPPGATAEEVALGRKIFAGEVDGATCAGCHGPDGIGTPVGPGSHQRQSGFGATAASRPSKKTIRSTACRSPRNIPAPCRRWAVSSCPRTTSPPSPPTFNIGH